MTASCLPAKTDIGDHDGTDHQPQDRCGLKLLASEDRQIDTASSCLLAKIGGEAAREWAGQQRVSSSLAVDGFSSQQRARPPAVEWISLTTTWHRLRSPHSAGADFVATAARQRARCLRRDRHEWTQYADPTRPQAACQRRQAQMSSSSPSSTMTKTASRIESAGEWTGEQRVSLCFPS